MPLTVGASWKNEVRFTNSDQRSPKPNMPSSWAHFGFESDQNAQPGNLDKQNLSLESYPSCEKIFVKDKVHISGNCSSSSTFTSVSKGFTKPGTK